MNLSLPILWSEIKIGDVVQFTMHDGDPTPRRVLDIVPPVPGGLGMVFAEGREPTYFYPHWTTRRVALDEADAIGNLFIAGLTPAPVIPPHLSNPTGGTPQ